MIGIIVASHGPMATGIIETSQWFFGKQPQLRSLCLQPEQNIENFDEQIKNLVREVDTGDGVIILCDLLFGTPCNRSALQLNDNIELIAGVNLGMLLEILSSRETYEGTLKDFVMKMVETGKNCVADVKAILSESE